MSITFQLHLIVFLWVLSSFFFKSMFHMIFKIQIQYNVYLGHCIHCIKFDLNDQRSTPIYQPNNCQIKEWSALIYLYNKYHKTNVNVTPLGHFLGQLSHTQNWTVLTPIYIQLLVCYCWERLHTANMETNIL